MTKGTYALYFQLSHSISIDIKTLGKIIFQKGNYIYVGSALGLSPSALEFRIKRHFQRKKSIQWHIDYLTTNEHYLPIGAVLIDTPEKKECETTRILDTDDRVFSSIPRFGASDCKQGCVSHLFQTELSMDTIFKLIRNSIDKNIRITTIRSKKVKPL
ncbi:MAG: GIY-YIG nuclease family protein [Candidatus Ranarchaeia archaeon]